MCVYFLNSSTHSQILESLYKISAEPNRVYWSSVPGIHWWKWNDELQYLTSYICYNKLVYPMTIVNFNSKSNALLKCYETTFLVPGKSVGNRLFPVCICARFCQETWISLTKLCLTVWVVIKRNMDWFIGKYIMYI